MVGNGLGYDKWLPPHQCGNGSKPDLKKRIRFISVNVPKSTNVAIFTFLPLGLVTDEPGQAQWTHLAEHLILRTTIPTNSTEANAETLPDHMRLDFYGNTNNWKDGLSHHARWISGIPFKEETLAAEKSKVISECDFTVRNLATHKFAIAAWAQGFRHGEKKIALKGDVTRAALRDVQQLRDTRMAVANHVSICIVGNVATKDMLAEADRQIGSIPMQAKLARSTGATLKNLDLTWDLDARHLLLTWPIPDFRHEDYAGLMASAQCLNMLCATDSTLTKAVGMVFAGADLSTPEGNFFFISASLRPGADFETVRAALLGKVAQLPGSAPVQHVRFMGESLAQQLTEIPDLATVKATAPAHVTMAMLEANSGLQMGMNEHRLGTHRLKLARELTNLSPADVRRAVENHLSPEKAAACKLEGEKR